MRRHAGLIVAAQLLAGAAAADPYPFSGFYALETPGQAQAGCGFDILHQAHSGAFSGYILDRRHWDAHREARFLRYKHGTCAFDGQTGIDNCVTAEDHINDASGKKADRARITILDDTRVAMLTLGEDDDPAEVADLPPFVFRKCPFDEAAITPRLTDGVAGYTRDELRDMARTRDEALLTQVLEQLADPTLRMD